MDAAIRSFSFGGGWQSTAALVLAARGELDFPLFLFSNVGDDSEHPGTLAYIKSHAAPFATAHGIELVTLHKVMKRTGEQRTLYQDLTRPGSRSLNIPVRMSNGAPGTRSCTADWKIKVIGDELKRRGATADNPATVGIGISVDEIGRVNNRRTEPYEQIEYPLLDLRIRRADCPGIIRSAGLPVPPKSSCWFCPMHRPSAWSDMRRENPDLFDRACRLETLLNNRRTELGKDPVWLTRFNAPLAEVIRNDTPLPMDFDDTDAACDSGHCFT